MPTEREYHRSSAIDDLDGVEDTEDIEDTESTDVGERDEDDENEKSEDTDDTDDTDGDIDHRTKRRRIDSGEVHVYGHRDDGDSDTDASIQLVAEREVSEEEEGEEDLDLLQALEESQQRNPHYYVGQVERETSAAEAGHESTADTTAAAPMAATSGIQAVSETTPYPETIDLEAEVAEQQVVEVPESEILTEAPTITPTVHKSVKDYRCPICFEPPDTAVMTPCGHVFCLGCLFQMVNSSRTHRRSGHCALCRTEVKLRDVRMIVLRKNRVKKEQ